MSADFNETLRSMGDMNPFDNNVPRLTASERIQNMRSRAIYDAAKSKFRSTGTCGDKNIRFYKKGTVRSVPSYEIQRDLARGNALCTDCGGHGTLCEAPLEGSDLIKLTMGNNLVSEFWGGAELETTSPNVVSQLPPLAVIVSDVSGVWDPSANDFKGDISMCGASGDIICPYGYAEDVIKIPRNLDGSGVVIDPSNNLFSEDACDPFRYMRLTQAKTTVKITADWRMEWAAALPNTDSSSFRLGCGDMQFKDVLSGNVYVRSSTAVIDALIGTFATMGTISAGVAGGAGWDGVIRRICCSNLDCNTVDCSGSSSPTIKGSLSSLPVFEIELFYMTGPQPVGGVTGAYRRLGNTEIGFAGPWEEAPGQMQITLAGNRDVALGSNTTYEIYYGRANNNTSSFTENTIFALEYVQGDCAVGVNLTNKNKTRQSYLHCIEDGTKKINFS